MLELSLDVLAQAQSRRRRPPPAPEPPKAAPRLSRARRWEMGLAVTVAGLAILVSIYILTREEPAKPTPVTAGKLELQSPPGWRHQLGAASLGGLAIERPAANLTPPRNLSVGERAVAGISGAASGPKLLTEAYSSQLGEGTEQQAVDLGSLEAYRYTGLVTPGSGEPVTIFVSPTSAGVATVACREPDGRARRAEADTCERIASTLRLANDVRSFPLGPSPALSRSLRKWLPRISARREKSLRAMEAAADADAQAAAAEPLAAVFGKAAAGLAELDITPESGPARDATVGAMRLAQRAYRELAAAARNEDAAGYESARRAARRAEAQLDARIEDLAQLGYEVGGVSPS